MVRTVIRIKRRNCKEGPWEYIDESGTTQEGSLYDAASSYTRRLAGRDVDGPGLQSLQITFKRRPWRRKDKRQYPHGNKGKLTIIMETKE